VKDHGVEFIQGLLLAFACMVILMPPFLRLLRWLGMGKQIRETGPEPTSSSRARRPWAAS